MEIPVVIKVKYGDTLRRFNSFVGENGQLGLNMEKLRAKVIGLFNFSLDTDVTLTYIDEDGDVVTLVDDDDLCDAERQNLHPLRINVVAKTEKAGRSYARSSGSSTPFRSPQAQPPLPSFKLAVDELLKSTPEPLPEVLSKVSLDMASKAAASAPVLAELVESFSRLGRSFLNPDSQIQFGADLSRQKGVPQNPSHQPVAAVPVVSKDGGSVQEVPADAKYVEPTSKGNRGVDVGNISRGVGTSAIQPSASVDTGMPVCSTRSGCTAVNVPPVPAGFPGIGSTTHPISHPPFISLKAGHSYKGSVPIFHRGVCCDGCGVNPISGPRFLSKIKEDYDLCSVCFSKMGDEADYIRMDRPASECPWLVNSLYDNPPGLRGPAFQHSLRGKFKLFQPKLDSRFVLDVNVMDGTVMAPSTHFTKIWRMRNCGNTAWPHGIQLAWIGGDRLNETCSIHTEIPLGGVPVDKELDIAVDLKAPKLPGRYVSYWMMSLPSGLKFGQLIWVLIQVDASFEEPSCDNLSGLNLNLPPCSNGPNGAELLDTEGRPLVEGSPSGPRNPTAAESVDMKQPIHDHDLNFPINDTLLVTSSTSDPSPSKVGFAEVPVVASSYEPSLVRNALETSEKILEDTNVEGTLLKELEEIGFREVDLNKEILRMNEFNMAQSLDNLSGVGEWDPILEELNEMGFCDNEMNRKLLKENNGSIKRVVMDLIAGDKAIPKEKTQ